MTDAKMTAIMFEVFAEGGVFLPLNERRIVEICAKIAAREMRTEMRKESIIRDLTDIQRQLEDSTRRAFR